MVTASLDTTSTPAVVGEGAVAFALLMSMNLCVTAFDVLWTDCQSQKQEWRRTENHADLFSASLFAASEEFWGDPG